MSDTQTETPNNTQTADEATHRGKHRGKAAAHDEQTKCRRRAATAD